MTSFVDPNDIAVLAGRTLTDTELAQVELMLDDICNEVRAVTGRTFLRQTSTVEIPGTTSDTLIIPDPPIWQIYTVSIDRLTVPDYWWTRDRLIRGWAGGIVNADYGVDPGAADYYPLSWGNANCTVALTYTHGGNPPPGVIAFVRRLALRSLTDPGGAIRSQSLGAWSESYAGATPTTGWLTGSDRRDVRRMCGIPPGQTVTARM